MNTVPALLAIAVGLLALIALCAAVTFRINSKSITQIVGVAVPGILLICVSVFVQFKLYELKPSLFDDSNGVLVIFDYFVGILVGVAVCTAIMND
jgi:hypothetical protein